MREPKADAEPKAVAEPMAVAETNGSERMKQLAPYIIFVIHIDCICI